VPDTADDPETTLQKKDRAEALRESLPRLSPEHQEVIDLAYYHSKSVKEIADIDWHQRGDREDAHVLRAQKLAELVASAYPQRLQGSLRSPWGLS
jgi:hypothetical protein